MAACRCCSRHVRLAVEESLALPEGSLSNSGFKSKIKATVLSVMAEIDGEAGSENEEDEEEEEKQREDDSPSSDGDGVDANNSSGNNNNHNNNGSSNNNKRGRDRVESSPGRHSKSGGRKRREPGPDSESADDESEDENADEKVTDKGRGQKAAINSTSRTTKKGKAKAAGKTDSGKPKGRDQEGGGAGGGENEDATLACVLSQTKLNRRQVNVRDWKGHVQVDIREHYQRKGTEEFAPSRKGISLNPTQWKALKKATRHVDEMLKQMT